MRIEVEVKKFVYCTRMLWLVHSFTQMFSKFWYQYPLTQIVIDTDYLEAVVIVEPPNVSCVNTCLNPQEV